MPTFSVNLCGIFPLPGAVNASARAAEISRAGLELIALMDACIAPIARVATTGVAGSNIYVICVNHTLKSPLVAALAIKETAVQAEIIM